MKAITWEIKFVQREMVKDGKTKDGRLYGPYWYGYNFEAPITRKVYIGKELPRELAHLSNDRATWAPPLDGQELASGRLDSNDLPSQLTLDTLATGHWLRTLAPKNPDERESVRKSVYHFCQSNRHDHNDKVACRAWFAEFCKERGWALPR